MLPVSPVLIEARQITKVYPNGARANDAVDFAVQQGEIHALVGENGAGKSTLMKILYGMERPTRGEIWLRGQPVQIHSPQNAIRLGIGMVHQNFMLVPSFTIAENVALNAEPRHGLAVDTARANAQVRALAEQYGLHVLPEARVESVPVGMRQRVEILKALYRGADIFILDEPTAVLTPGETRDLFAALRNLVAQGKTIIFITHKLREVRAIADRVTVMRDGRVVGTVQAGEFDEQGLARMMVGREVFEVIEKTPLQRGGPILQVRDLTCLSPGGKPALDRVSFDVHAGEIVGVAGVEGNGQRELAEALAGLRPLNGGQVRMEGHTIAEAGQRSDPRRIREAHIAHIPEDRLHNGSAAEASISDNLIADRYYRPPFARFGLLRPRIARQQANALIERFGVVAAGAGAALRSLSGGNIQKVVIARELSAAPRLLIAAQPTRGVDVGATEFIHRQLIDQRAAGLAILLISADLQEVMKLSDRLLVLYSGRIVAQLPDPAAVSEEELGLYMLGAKAEGTPT